MNKILYLVIIILIGIFVYFGYNCYNLYRFKNCYDNNFKLDYCKYYKNY